MNLLDRYRHWVITRTPRKKKGVSWFLLMVTLVLGIGMGAWLNREHEPAPPQTLCANEKDLLLECQNRLEIKEQALIKLNEVNVDLRERYRFLLSMMTSETRSPPLRMSKSGVNLRHFSVQRLQTSTYQYRLLLDFDQHATTSDYVLVFQFDQGKTQTVALDSSAFPPSQNKRTVLPFVGTINGEGQKLLTYTFYVRQQGKEVFTIQSKYEGEL